MVTKEFKKMVHVFQTQIVGRDRQVQTWNLRHSQTLWLAGRCGQGKLQTAREGKGKKKKERQAGCSPEGLRPMCVGDCHLTFPSGGEADLGEGHRATLGQETFLHSGISTTVFSVLPVWKRVGIGPGCWQRTAGRHTPKPHLSRLHCPETLRSLWRETWLEGKGSHCWCQERTGSLSLRTGTGFL